MNTTDLERADRSVALFAGATPADISIAATNVANTFSDIVKQQRLFKRIGDRDHILIEAWQTIATLTGTAAIEAGGVRELPWPMIELLGVEPPAPGPEPRRRESPEWEAWKAVDEVHAGWRHHRALLEARALGKAFGFAAAFRVVKNGQEIGWGEGRVDRTERTWVSRDDYALASMAQTRGQSRALGAPLRFIVKLAGYEPTLPEDLDGTAPSSEPPPAPWGPMANDDQENAAAAAVKRIAPDVNAEQFVLLIGQGFDGVPVAAVKTLTGLAKYIAASEVPPPETAPTPETTPPPATGPPDDVVYPPGHYQGD